MISLREYGVTLSTVTVATIGLCAFSADRWGWGMHLGDTTAGVTAGGALLVAGLHLALAETFIKDNRKKLPGDYTADQLVDYTALACFYTAIMCIVVSAWLQGTWFTALMIICFAITAGQWVHPWLEKRRPDRDGQPALDDDFRVVVWVAPIGTGILLLLLHAEAKMYAIATFAFFVLIHYGCMALKFAVLSRKKAADAKKVSLPQPLELPIRARIHVH